ncbi:MAG: FtsQ-type POTRA domain-containing protein [Candidatus Omnitrophica bacterium]|nr:FtsQ-type POTRA domain-containing protein [Candidatus Omnitrophota bacterium]
MARKKRRKQRKQKLFPRPLFRGDIISSLTGIAFKAVPLVLVLVVVGIGVKAATSMIFNSDYFKVKTINVSGRPSHGGSGPAAIVLTSKKGTNIFTIDLEGCAAEVTRRHPEFRDVKVTKVLPDILEISYKIRKPFCQVDSGRFYLVSDDCVVLPNPLIAAEPELPIITGVDVSERFLSPNRRSRSKALKNAIALLKEIEDSDFSKEYSVVKISVYSPHNPSIYLKDGTRIEIGEHSFGESEKVLVKVLDDLESKDKKAKIIDLRFDDVVVIPR